MAEERSQGCRKVNSSLSSQSVESESEGENKMNYSPAAIMAF
jgi:hypothetical protein